jgi:23S rRNA (adenine2503-C2)-methyltransferase
MLLQWPPPAPADPADSPDPAGGGLTECVMIPCDDDHADEYGNTTVTHRRTACLSTQVGCPVGCAFCASGMEGLKGNLTAGQVIEEALRLTHNLPAVGAGHRLTNVVFMGMGEPLANFNATVAAVRVLMAPWAFHISGRKITVSTVGLPPQMKRLADLELPVTLAISLHAPNDDLRKRIIPWAEKISISQLIDAGKYYFEKTGREVTLEYIMLEGVNTLPEHARELATIARKLRANVNLIYYNEVPELPFKRPTGQVMFAFQNILRTAGVNVHVRKSRGREIAAACGQLARQDRQPQALGLPSAAPSRTP